MKNKKEDTKELYGTSFDSIFVDDVVEDIPEESVVVKDKKAKVIKGSLNLRKDPSKESDIIAIIPDKTEITVFEDDGEWIHAKFEDKDGWVMAEFVEVK